MRPRPIAALRALLLSSPLTTALTLEAATSWVVKHMAGGGGGGGGGQDQHAEDDDDDDVMVVSSTLTVSLLDPVSLSRIALPARGQPCAHIACFDLDTLLEFSGSGASAGMKCPICHKVRRHGAWHVARRA